MERLSREFAKVIISEVEQRAKDIVDYTPDPERHMLLAQATNVVGQWEPVALFSKNIEGEPRDLTMVRCMQPHGEWTKEEAYFTTHRKAANAAKNALGWFPYVTDFAIIYHRVQDEIPTRKFTLPYRFPMDRVQVFNGETICRRSQPLMTLYMDHLLQEGLVDDGYEIRQWFDEYFNGLVVGFIETCLGDFYPNPARNIQSI